MNPAIVTTLRGARDTLESFIRHHQALGFERIYLFFDDPCDTSIEIAARFAGVVSILHDERLRRSWQTSRLGLLNFVEREVMARQALNAEQALQLALADGVSWLLHIDADELFMPMGTDLRSHFDELSRSGVDAVRYFNLEAVPEHAHACDCFRELTLFKVNAEFQPGRRFSEPQRRLLQATERYRERFFSSYANGKGAARVAAGLLPDYVHGFRAHAGPTRTAVGAGVILHYPAHSFEQFWSKYQLLGRFEDRWFGHAEIRSAVGGFHLAARDVVAQGDRALALDFYRKQVVLEDEQLVEQFTRQGLLRRISDPALRLSAPSGGERDCSLPSTARAAGSAP